MQLAIELLATAGVSVATLLIARRVLPESAARRHAAALALGVAFFLGFPLLIWGSPGAPQLSGPWQSTWRYWHWLPYLGAVAMVLGPLALAEGVYAVERFVLHALLALVAAWLVVPTWSTLEPSRPVWVALLAGYLFLLGALLDPLPERLAGRLFLPLLAGAAACAALLVAASLSLTYGKLSAVAAAALVGSSVAARFDTGATLARGLVPAFGVIVGACAFVGCVYPTPPMLGLLVAPAAPLALWACTFGPLSRLRGARAAAAQVGVVLVPLIAAVLLAWLGEAPAADY